MVDENDCRGPCKTYDKRGKTNPVITDQISCRMKYSPYGNIGKDKSYNFSTFNSHLWGGVPELSNQAFIDGHVKAVDAEKLKARLEYGSSPNGWWKWR
ncbi:hypothetical protein [Sedimentisphaera cyanobacteriorum]|uniref:hypothetical protein n=1 Tax=Sedimentisphaera cyanobacteriorum TaxID=1940790 RepID=UPI000F4E45A0|nr:hypothetical protein [Sedimentisphaera cyanobacteriorum]